ncbi:hypothetical protein FB451DRAFT_1570347 [Mycena latifolia]|nr:hypothetical protein FB451DRAFT_1570347 [Mycena latifolia]
MSRGCTLNASAPTKSAAAAGKNPPQAVSARQLPYLYRVLKAACPPTGVPLCQSSTRPRAPNLCPQRVAPNRITLHLHLSPHRDKVRLSPAVRVGVRRDRHFHRRTMWVGDVVKPRQAAFDFAPRYGRVIDHPSLISDESRCIKASNQRYVLINHFSTQLSSLPGRVLGSVTAKRVGYAFPHVIRNIRIKPPASNTCSTLPATMSMTECQKL